MQYKGKLYGRVGTKYFDTGKTADDWDELEKFKDLHYTETTRADLLQEQVDNLKKEMEWISVENYLPPLYTQVIVKDDDGNHILAEIGGDEEDFYETRHPKAPYLKGIVAWKHIK